MPFDPNLSFANLLLPLLPLLWGVLAGLVFSMVGAAGGNLLPFGLVSVPGVLDANPVKPMTQMLTLATPTTVGATMYSPGLTALVVASYPIATSVQWSA